MQADMLSRSVQGICQAELWMVLLLTLVTPLLNEAVTTVFALAGKGSTASTRYQTVSSCSSCKSPPRLQTASLQARHMQHFQDLPAPHASKVSGY